MNVASLRELTRGSDDWSQALAWSSLHFDRALLFLGDASAPLVSHARFWSWVVRGDVRGVAVRFDGVPVPVVSAAGDDAACAELIAASAVPGATLVTHETQWLPSTLASRPSTHSRWLDAACRRVPPRAEVCRVEESGELASFQEANGMRHWHPEMLQFGHCFGVRENSGALVSVGGVSFSVPGQSYAQLGGLLTAKQARGRGYASAVIEAIRTSLADAGVTRCGLFADPNDDAVSAFYAARGFESRGRFRFSSLS
jgi:ribosomal protein S18 acetylase RimI-like enzyme